MSTFIFYIWCYFILSINSNYLEHVDEYDPSWIRIGRTNPEKLIELLFALKQQNVNVLIDKLICVSDPSNRNYGKHLSREIVNNIVSPSIQTYTNIKQWLISFGIDEHNIINKTSNGDFISILTNINTAEKILNCYYYDYYNELIDNYIVSRIDVNMNYDIPSNIAKHLDFISPTKRFPSIQHIRYRNKYNYMNTTSPEDDVTPLFLDQLYQINNTKGQSSSNKQGISSFLGEYFNNTDIMDFWSEYNITSNSINSTITRLSNNKSQPSGYGVESTLNVEYMTSIGQNISTEIWYTVDLNQSNNIVGYEPFLTFLLDILNSTYPAWLFIIGYNEYEFNLGYEYCTRCNTEIAKIGAMGISLLVMSGNLGTGSDQQCCSKNPYKFCPTFPATSPYITSVGGTVGGTIGNEPTGETAWHPSGGGFSNFFPMPAYQNKSVYDFISLSQSMNQLPDESLFNISGRAYPDIAGNAYLYDIIVNGTLFDYSGTDCGLSVVGGIFALLNDIRLQNNQSTLGWLNILIGEFVLKDELSFNDITCDCPNNACNGIEGFHAIKGWDAVTGWGTPNYARLKTYILNMSMVN